MSDLSVYLPTFAAALTLAGALVNNIDKLCTVFKNN
jgi:hypothetical protein